MRPRSAPYPETRIKPASRALRTPACRAGLPLATTDCRRQVADELAHPLRAGARGPLAQLDLDGGAIAAVAEDGQPNLLTRRVSADLVRQVMLARERLPVHGHDQVAALRDVGLA